MINQKESKIKSNNVGLEDIIDKISISDFHTSNCLVPSFLMESMNVYKNYKNIERAIQLCLDVKTDEMPFQRVYICASLGNLFEEFYKDINAYRFFIQNYDSLIKKIRKKFSFVPFYNNISKMDLIDKEPIINQLEGEDKDVIKSIIEIGIREMGPSQSRWLDERLLKLGLELKAVSESFYKELSKDFIFLDNVEKSRFCGTKNEVYEIVNPILKETIVIKNSKKENSNLKLEKDMIEYYNKTEPRIPLANVINFEIFKNKEYLFLKRKKGATLLDFLEICDKLKQVIENSKDFYECIDAISKKIEFYPLKVFNLQKGRKCCECGSDGIMDNTLTCKRCANKPLNSNDKVIVHFTPYKEIPKDKTLKYIIEQSFINIYKEDINDGSYKNKLATHFEEISTKTIESCLAKLARLNVNLSKNNVNKEFNRGDYKKEVISIWSAFESSLGKKLSRKFKDIFLKNYDIIDSTLSAAPKLLYKDAYPRNWIIPEAGLIMPIDFERCALAPPQLDLAFLLDFGNFVKEEDKNRLINTYLSFFEIYIQRLVSDKKANITSKGLGTVFNEKEFKRVFDYACVHRNLLTFRSYSKFIDRGEDSKKAEIYKKMSLENSIKALQKLISYEKNNVNKLRSLCNDLENVYHKIYR